MMICREFVWNIINDIIELSCYKMDDNDISHHGRHHYHLNERSNNFVDLVL